MAQLTLDEQIARANAELERLEAVAPTSRPIRRRLRNKLTNRRIATLGDGPKGRELSDERQKARV